MVAILAFACCSVMGSTLIAPLPHPIHACTRHIAQEQPPAMDYATDTDVEEEFEREEDWDKGKGLDAHLYSPKDPQWWLAGSNHPYAPFVGNPLAWESFVYDDGTT